jgi:hypothetical protein
MSGVGVKGALLPSACLTGLDRGQGGPYGQGGKGYDKVRSRSGQDQSKVMSWLARAGQGDVRAIHAMRADVGGQGSVKVRLRLCHSRSPDRSSQDESDHALRAFSNLANVGHL